MMTYSLTHCLIVRVGLVLVFVFAGLTGESANAKDIALVTDSSVEPVDAERPAALQRKNRPLPEERFGWMQKGIFFVLPRVGITSAFAQGTKPGWGYVLGAQAGVEVWPRWLVGLEIEGGVARGARAPLRYLIAGESRQISQEAVFRHLALIGIIGHQLRHQEWPVAVHLQAGAGVQYGGYDYFIEDGLNLKAVNQEASLFEASCEGNANACGAFSTGAQGYAPTAMFRVGIEGYLKKWLSAELNFAISYASLPSRPVRNTAAARQVRSVAQSLFLGQVYFGLKAGL